MPVDSPANLPDSFVFINTCQSLFCELASQPFSIQDKYGSDTIRVRTDGGVAVLQNLNGVERINDYGQVQELRMASDCDSQELLAEVMSRTRVRSFEIVKPSLHDIFIRIAGPEATEVNNAEDT